MVEGHQDGDTELTPNLLSLLEELHLEGMMTLILVIVDLIYCVIDLIQTEERYVKRIEIDHSNI
jgi:hypothetical protein